MAAKEKMSAAIDRTEPGTHRQVRIESRPRGLVDWLLSCPDKGYFVPIEFGSTHQR